MLKFGSLISAAALLASACLARADECRTYFDPLDETDPPYLTISEGLLIVDPGQEIAPETFKCEGNACVSDDGRWAFVIDYEDPGSYAIINKRTWVASCPK